MKILYKSIALGLSMNILNRICGFIFFGMDSDTVIILSGIIFGIVITAFLISDSISKLFICGFAGFFTMIVGEIRVFSLILPIYDICPYIGGFISSFPAVTVALVLTAIHFKPSNYFSKAKDGIIMTKAMRIKLIIYAVVSSVSFSYLILPQNSGISVVLFSLLQFLMLWYIAPSKKRLILFVPVFLMSLNCFISGSNVWRISNLIVSIILYGCMFTDISFKNDTFEFITNTLINIIYSFTHFLLPFKWAVELNSEKAPLVKRILIAVGIAIPCAVVLVIVLSNIDMVFSLKTGSFINGLSSFISINTIVKAVFGTVAGLFLFGVMYNSHCETTEQNTTKNQHTGDLVIINILLSTILVIYTMFVIIQFKYLFAGSALPDGLTYTQYARKGFFELLALTGVNIAIILTVTKLTKSQNGVWLNFSKVLCHYLCAITIILLASSFYRMFLYTNDDGLTRLRFFVMGFLVFEAIGLIVTFFYIHKPKFNIVLIYTVTALTYYSLLNIIPADRIIAKNQIDKYLDGKRNDIDYIFTLSSDSIPAMEYLYENTDDENTKKRITYFVSEQTKSDIPDRWQRFNLSVYRAKDFLK